MSSKDENENENDKTLMSSDEDDENENDKTLMPSNEDDDDHDDDETISQNEKTYNNKRLKWTFRCNNWQIKIIWSANKIVKKK